MNACKKLLCGIIFFSTAQLFSQDLNYNESQLIVKISDKENLKVKLDYSEKTFGLRNLDSLNQKYFIDSIESIGNSKVTHTFLLTFKNPQNIVQLVKEYQINTELEFAEPNYIAIAGGVQNKDVFNFPNDFYFNRQWGLNNDGSFTVGGMGYSSVYDADVDMDLAWDIETGDPNLIIAVSDSGLNMNHVDIASRIWSNNNDPIDGIDNDGNGFIDDFNGWDWVNSDNNPTDDHGHGTNCAGIIGTIANNSVGYAGVNWNSKIMPLKVLSNTNNGTYANMANSIYYAADNGAKIISMSIGGSATSAVLSNAIDYANTQDALLVACMMNFNNNVTYYPAGYAATKPNVIAVGSTNSDDRRTNPFFWSATSGSNFGNHINVVAPGNYIWGLGISSTTDYNSYWGGTSQATPLVAGIASLLKSKNSALTPVQIRDIIATTAEDQVGLSTEDIAGWDQYMGSGRVNALAALSSVLGTYAPEFDTNKLTIVNPVTQNQLSINAPAALQGDYELLMFTFDGKKINEKQQIHLNQGSNVVDFKYPKGAYILTITGHKYSKVFKIVNQ